MDTMSSIDKQECLNSNGLRHKTSVLLISVLCSLIFVGLTYVFILIYLERAILLPCECCVPLTVHTWRRLSKGEAKSFFHQVWWKITIVWVLSRPSAHITPLDDQKCHSQDSPDILETLQFANNRHCSERETCLLTTLWEVLIQTWEEPRPKTSRWIIKNRTPFFFQWKMWKNE